MKAAWAGSGKSAVGSHLAGGRRNGAPYPATFGNAEKENRKMLITKNKNAAKALKNAFD